MTACAVGAQRPPGLRENVIRPVVAGMNEHSVAVGVPILQPLRLLPFAEDAAILGRDADIDKTVIESGTVEEAYVETEADVQPFDEQRAIEKLTIAGTEHEQAGGDRDTPENGKAC